MADPRLRWTQVNAPSFAGAAALLSQANNSFTNGIGAAQDILSKYNTGQQEKEDAALIADLAGLKYEDDFGAFVDGGGLNNRNISDALRGEVLSMRRNLLANDSTRAGTEATRASTSRANAAEARTQFNFEDEVARTQARRAAAGGILNATGAATNSPYDLGSNEARFVRRGDHVFGNADSGQGPVNDPGGAIPHSDADVLALARTIQAEAANQGSQGMQDVASVIRNRTLSGKYGQGVNGVIMRPGQFSAWNSVTGYAGGEQGQDMNFQPSEEALKIARATLAGNVKDQTGGATHYYNPDISRPAWGAQSPDEIGNNNQRTLAAQQQALVDTGLFSASEILAQTQGIADARKATDDKLVAETHANIVLDALQNNTTVDAAVQDSLSNTTELPATEILKIAQDVQAAGTSDTGQSILTPQGAALAPEVEASVALANAAVDEANSSTPQGQLLTDAARLNENGDPIGALAEELRLGKDGQDPWFGSDSTFDDNSLSELIHEIAAEENISLDKAAAAAKRSFVRDPWFRNTLTKRFPKAEIVDRIRTDLAQDKVQNYRESRASQEVFRQRQAAVLSRMQQIQSEMNKSGADRNALSDELARLTLELTQLQSKNKPSDRVNSAEPQSPRDIFEEVVGASAP